MNVLVRITSEPVADVTTFGSARALRMLHEDFPETSLVLLNYHAVRLTMKYKKTNIFMASVIYNRRNGRQQMV